MHESINDKPKDRIVIISFPSSESPKVKYTPDRIKNNAIEMV